MHASVILSHAAALLRKMWESTNSVLATGSEWLVNLYRLESIEDQRWWLWHSPEHAPDLSESGWTRAQRWSGGVSTSLNTS